MFINKEVKQVLHKTIYFTIQTTCYVTKHCQKNLVCGVFGYASTYINDPYWHLTLQHTSSVSNNQHMINYPQLIRHEWFDLGKKMTLPDCMNYNYTRPNWVYMYMYYKKIFFVQWEMTQYQ